jgi:N-acyl-D-amino-acid deacylase
MGEGESMGPLNARMKQDAVSLQGDIKYPIQWTTLGEYLEHSRSVAYRRTWRSFVGATTVRIHELGHADRAPTRSRTGAMKALVRQAMEEGALGRRLVADLRAGVFTRRRTS